jgi:CubicO group peptidase (beta-lactamase class C family)
MNRMLLFWTLLAFTLTVFYAQPADADGPDSTRAGPADPVEIEAFVDDFWRGHMQPLNIPGAVFALVRDGEILFAKGYGLADVDKGTPVDPGETLFAIGSVSKAVTASAVLQLVERGQLDLDAPVDGYLRSMQVGDRCSQAVTTAHLLTHTAGIDERVIGTYVTSADQLAPLAEVVARDLPPCIRPPGQEMSYCNHCYGLAGLVLEEVSGLPFEQYVQENLFQPLEMRHSTFRQLLRPELDALRGTGYIFAPEIQPAPQVHTTIFPAGGAWASGEDIGHFIIGLLQGGLAGGEPVFERVTLALMHQRQFTQDPRLEGWTYGFFEHLENGERLIGKDGDSPGFSSSLYLMPEQDLGFFLSFNATVPAGQDDPRHVFPGHFLDHYFPANGTLPPAVPSGAASRLSGLYRWSRFGHTSIDKAISPMLLVQWRISANPDGSFTLVYPSLLGGQTSRWVEVEPGLFQNQESGSYLLYDEDDRGRITHVYAKIGEEGVLERVAWYESLTIQALLLVLLVVMFATALVARLVGALGKIWLARRGRQPVRSPGSWVLRPASWLSAALSGLGLLFLAGLALAVSHSLNVRAPEVPPYMLGLLVIPLIAVLLAPGLLALTVLAWKHRYGSTLSRMHHTLVTLAGLAFVWFAWYWNLLGFKL